MRTDLWKRFKADFRRKCFLGAVVTVFCIVMLTGCKDDKKTEDTQQSTEDAASQVEFEVTDAFSDVIKDELYMNDILCYHIPQVVIGADSCETVNAKMYDELYGLLDSEVYEYAERGDSFPELSEMSYAWGNKDSIVSVIVETNQTQWVWTEYYVYNVSAITGEEAELVDLLNAFSLTEEDYYDLVKQTLEKYWDGREEELLPHIGEDMFHSLVENTLSMENVKKAVPYVNGDGELCVVVDVYSPAGSGYYRHLFNVSQKKEETQIECGKDHTGEVRLILTEEQEEETTEEAKPEKPDSAVITEADLLGEWTVDTEYTMDYNNMSMWDFYGSSFSDSGHSMKFGTDGSFEYYVAWCYGDGTYNLNGDTIQVDIIGDPLEGEYELVVTSDGQVRIGLDQYGDGSLIFWMKK